MASKRMVNVTIAAATAMSQARTCARVMRVRTETPVAGLEGSSLWEVEKLTLGV